MKNKGLSIFVGVFCFIIAVAFGVAIAVAFGFAIKSSLNVALVHYGIKELTLKVTLNLLAVVMLVEWFKEIVFSKKNKKE